MTLLEIQAIRALPEEYVKEGVRAVRCDKVVVVACPGKPAIIYDPETKGWRAMDTGFLIPEKVGKLTRTEAEAMGLPCEPKGDVGKLFES